MACHTGVQPSDRV